MDEKWKKRFIDALTVLQIGFKEEHGRFPNSQENNELIKRAEKVARQYADYRKGGNAV